MSYGSDHNGLASCVAGSTVTVVPKSDQENLLGAPVLMQGLFGSILSVAQTLKRLEEELSQLSHHLFAHSPLERNENNNMVPMTSGLQQHV